MCRSCVDMRMRSIFCLNVVFMMILHWPISGDWEKAAENLLHCFIKVGLKFLMSDDADKMTADLMYKCFMKRRNFICN